jgi:DNA-binding NarL/FixJ family response regulator
MTSAADQKRQIMIVDDNCVLLHAIRDALDRETDLHVAGVATDAEGALEIARRQRVDLALLDIRMPGLSGIELTRILRVEHPRLVVVLMSAYEPTEQLREARAAGAVELLDKTAPTDELVRRVRTLAATPSVRPGYEKTGA